MASSFSAKPPPPPPPRNDEHVDDDVAKGESERVRPPYVKRGTEEARCLDSMWLLAYGVLVCVGCV